MASHECAAVAETSRADSDGEDGVPMSDKPEDNVLWHQSGVNRDGEAFIQLILNDKVIAQQSIEQAREHAKAVLEACEAAEQDAFLVYFFKKQVGLSENQAARILVDFREWRMRETGKRSGQEVRPEGAKP
jgi:hypothetical protein